MYFSYDIIIVTVTSDGFQLNESIATFFFFFFSLFVNRKEKKNWKEKEREERKYKRDYISSETSGATFKPHGPNNMYDFDKRAVVQFLYGIQIHSIEKKKNLFMKMAPS